VTDRLEDHVEELVDALDEAEEEFDPGTGEEGPCWYCDDEGSIHDCGDDTCGCLHPDVDDRYPCPECGGGGG